MLRVIEAQGDYFACGKVFGASCRESIAFRIKRELAEHPSEEYQLELEKVDTLCKKLYPEYVSELEGIAEGSGASYWDLLLLNTPELMERAQGCTTVAVSNAEEQYLVHNEDANADERAEDCVILHYVLPNVSFYAFTYAGELAGGSYSWNSHGLYFSVNYVKPIDIDFEGRVSRNFVARKVIEAESIEAAVAILEHGQDVSGYHYYVGQEHHLVSIENFRNEVSLQRVEGTDVHANHYLHKKFLARATGKSNSIVRQQRAEELRNRGVSPLDILTDRANLPDAICTNFGEGLHTISTIGFYPQKKKIRLYEPGTLIVEAEYQI